MQTAVDVSVLLYWVYSRQQAHSILGGGLGLFEQERKADGVNVATVSGDGCYQIARRAEMGTRVDGGGMGNGEIHPDAEVVYGIVKKLGHPWSGILERFGKTGMIPDLENAGYGARPIIREKLKRNGKPEMILDANRNPIAPKIEVILAQEEIDFKRAVYVEWYEAQIRLVEKLRAVSLVMWKVTGPAAPSKPWENQRDFFMLDGLRQSLDAASTIR